VGAFHGTSGKELVFVTARASTLVSPSPKGIVSSTSCPFYKLDPEVLEANRFCVLNNLNPCGLFHSFLSTTLTKESQQ
jgi:hypothetical protein